MDNGQWTMDQFVHGPWSMVHKTRTLFFGTPDFAASVLEALLANPRFEVVGVVTQPDRPMGRKKIMTPPPVAALAKEKGIKLFQPEKLKDLSVQDEILSAKPELAVVVAYGNLIPKRMLEAVERGFVNIHPSLLPKHRGAAPITSTILAGDKEAGVCLMRLDELMDHGPIIACRRMALDGTETSASLRAKLAPVAGQLLNSELVDFLDGKIVPESQDHDAATFSKRMESADAHIDWNKSMEEIERLVRAMNGITPAWTTLDGGTFLVHRAHPDGYQTLETPGKVMLINKNMAVAAKDGFMILDEVQPAGGKSMSGQAYLNGHKDITGKILA